MGMKRKDPFFAALAAVLATALAAALAVNGAGCDAGKTADGAGGAGGEGSGGAGPGSTGMGGAAASSGNGSSSGPGTGGGGPGSSSSSSSSSGSGSGSGGGSPAPGGYYVQGNAIYNKDGEKHVFHGIARPSTEWNPQGEMISKNDFMLQKSWGANVTRLSLNQGFWLPGHAKYDAQYQQNIDQAVQWAKEVGLDVILDLHWSDRGNLQNQGPGQQRMADANSVTFWTSVATKYKDDGRVLFELYNEPHDVPWNVWLSGGDSGDGFTAAGMQDLYDAVRATGAKNLVLIGGLNYAYDLSGVPANRVQGSNIVYVTHPYNFQGKQPSDWDAGWGFLAATDPIMVTEFGTFDCSTNYYSQLIAYMDARSVSWTAWAWYPGGCGFPAVINDWGGSPNAPGQVIKSALLSY